MQVRNPIVSALSGNNHGNSQTLLAHTIDTNDMKLQLKLRRNARLLLFLLNSPSAVLPLLKYVHSTGRFKSFFGKDKKDKVFTNARRNMELQERLEQVMHDAAKRVRNL